MKEQLYRIHWRNEINGCAGKAYKAVTKDVAEAQVKKLNKGQEYRRWKLVYSIEPDESEAQG